MVDRMCSAQWWDQCIYRCVSSDYCNIYNIIISLTTSISLLGMGGCELETLLWLQLSHLVVLVVLLVVQVVLLLPGLLLGHQLVKTDVGQVDDGGDCEEFNRQYRGCSKEIRFPSWIGDGVCDDGSIA